MLSVNYNSASANAVNQVANAQKDIAATMTKLTTGNRINTAADDVAGSAMASRMQVQSNSLDTSVTNANMGMNLIQTMDGAMQETQDLLQRMTKLTEMSMNNAYSTQDREMMDQEFTSLVDELDRNAQSANYNGISLINNEGHSAASTTFDMDISKGVTFAGAGAMTITVDDGAARTVNFAAGAKLSADEIVSTINKVLEGAGDNAKASINSEGKLTIESGNRVDGSASAPTLTKVEIAAAPPELNSVVAPATVAGKAGFNDIVINVGSSGNDYDNIYLKTTDLSSKGLGLDTASLTNAADLDKTLSGLKAALDTTTEHRSHLGASQTRLEFASENLQNVKNNTDSSLSSIQDTDYATETMNLAKSKVLNSASQAMLGQANQMQDEVTQLLR